MVSSHRPAAGRRPGVTSYELRPQWLAIACNCARTDASITVSPTVIRAPPTSSGSTLTVGSIFLPKRFSSAVLSSATCSSVERERAVDPRRRDAFGVVLQRVEQLRDVRQQRDALGLDQHPHEAPPLGVELVAARRTGRATPCRPPSASDCRAPARIARIGDDRARVAQHRRPDRQRLPRLRRARRRPPRTAGRSSSVRPWRLPSRARCRIDASSSACAFASTSRFRIFSAPATARSATWSRSVSFARATSCWISAFAAARIRSASAFASAFAASTVSLLSFSPWAMISELRLLRLGHHVGDPLLRVGEALAAFLARGEAVGDRLLARVDRAHQRRPDEPRREPDERGERDRLHEQREIDVHRCLRGEERSGRGPT